MKLRLTLVLLFSLVFILIAVSSAGAQTQTTVTQYKIQLNSGSSASWTIIQVSGLNATVDSFTDFQQKVNTLVSAAGAQTQRPMGADSNSFQTSTNVTSSDSKTTVYMFTWLNFSQTGNEQLTVGDVFGVPGFFNQLYGDGSLQINYPANYTLKSVSPAPDERDDATQTLQWLGTQFLGSEQPNIILAAQNRSAADSGQPPFLLIGAVLAVVAAAAVGVWLLLSKRRLKGGGKELAAAPSAALLETEEEKVIKVLRANGGSAYQSAITEQCRFSKAKTSQLLSALEAKGVVQRYKKGRDKIVNLTEQAKDGK